MQVTIENISELIKKGKVEVLVIADTKYVVGEIINLVAPMSNGCKMVKNAMIKSVTNNYGGSTELRYFNVFLESC